MAAPAAKKLLVLDVNGLLVATYHHKHGKLPAGPHHAKLGNFYVYMRPSCEEFLKFCFENFVVGIWSSAREHNVNLFVDFIFKDLKPALAFSWHQQHCTTTKVKHPDNDRKPIFLKELSKLWANLNPEQFGPSNSLLVDDSPYKALKNPPNTAIFPRSYTADEADDNFLGVLQKYLEGLRDSLDVQKYVSENPIGEPSITSESPLWSIFSSIVGGDSPTTQVVQAIEDAKGYVQEVQEDVKQRFGKITEYRDVEHAGKRRHFSPTLYCEHSTRSRVQGLPETADLMLEHEGNAFSDQLQDDDQSKNGYHSWGHRGRIRERGRGRERPRREREGSRSPQRHQDYSNRIDGDCDRYIPEFVVAPSSSYSWECNSSRNGSSRGSYHRRGTSSGATRNRNPFVAEQYGDHKGYGAQGERQFAPTIFNNRDLQPHILPFTGQPIYGIASQPNSHIGHSGQTEQAYSCHNMYQGERQFNDGSSGMRPDYDRRWQEPAYSGHNRYQGERQFNDGSSGTRPDYDRRWQELAYSGHNRYQGEKQFNDGSSGTRPDYDRRWQEPAYSGHNRYQGERQFNDGSSWTTPDYDRRWQEPAYSGKTTVHDPRWNRRPVSQYVAPLHT